MSALRPVAVRLAGLDPMAEGRLLHELAAELFLVPRSLTGDGVRQTLARLAQLIPNLVVNEVPSGTPALDWQVPNEWNVHRAFIEGPEGPKTRRFADFSKHRLHLLGYSVPVNCTVDRDELEQHLYSLPEFPDLIPYRTSYYVQRWGFCLTENERRSLPPGRYRCVVETTLEPGSLTYGEVLIPGRSSEEILFSCHICHPQLANDNLSGVVVAARLAQLLAALPAEHLRYSYRFVFVPGTIGSIVWLARNQEGVSRVRGGLVAANLGDSGPFHYKRSRRGDNEIDRIVPRALGKLGEQVVVEDFVPFGYDERQYGSPGFDLAVGSLTRTPWGRYPEYHTSADDLSFVLPESLGLSLRAYLAVVAEAEAARFFENLNPRGEPQLGRRGLYTSLGGGGSREAELALLWVLNQSDGRHSLEDIAERSGIELAQIEEAAQALRSASLLRVIS